MKSFSRQPALFTPTRISLLLIASFTTASSLLADDKLATMTVTANRMATNNALAPTTVITRAEIDRLQITDLASLLERQPGIDVTRQGGLGKVSSIFMRGTNSDHVLVLVDGVKWQSATLGTSAIEHFPVEQIERIEIVRGPRSGLYGAEALGGVIQIFTRQGKTGMKPSVKLGYGSDDSQQFAAGIHGGNEQTHYNLSFNHLATDGISSRDKTLDNPDDDGYRSNSLAASVQQSVNDRLSLGAQFIRSEGKNEYDGFNKTDDNESEVIQQVLSLNSQLKLSELWAVSLRIGESRDQSIDIKNGVQGDHFNTRHQFANINNIFTLSDQHTVNLGLDYDVDKVDADTLFSEDSRDNRAGFISWQGNAQRHSWLISARHDDNEAYGNYNTGTAEWGFALQEGLTLTANIGTAFKAPTFNDLYYPNTPFFVGNPALKPEKSKSMGLGLNANQSWGTWGIHAYKTDIRDLLIYVFPTTENVDKAKIKGIEFNLGTTILDWDIAANASFLKPVQDDKDEHILARRAQRLANISLDKQWGAWSTGASWKLRGHSYDDAANTTRLGGYGLLDLRLAYQINPDWTLQSNISNVLNKEYKTINTYNNLDRTVMVTISYTP